MATIVQIATGTWANPAVATFASAVTAGNTVVAVASERSGGSGDDFTLSGTGWTNRSSQTVEPLSSSFRRSLSTFTKVAGGSEPLSFSVSNSSGGNCALMLFELQQEVGDDQITFLEAVTSDNGASSADTSLDIGPTSTLTDSRKTFLAVMQVKVSGFSNPAQGTFWTNSFTPATTAAQEGWGLNEIALTAGIKSEQTVGNQQTRGEYPSGTWSNVGLSGVILVFRTSADAAPSFTVDSTDSQMQRQSNFSATFSTVAATPTTANTSIVNGSDTILASSVTGSDPYTAVFPIGDIEKQVGDYDWTLNVGAESDTTGNIPLVVQNGWSVQEVANAVTTEGSVFNQYSGAAPQDGWDIEYESVTSPSSIPVSIVANGGINLLGTPTEDETFSFRVVESDGAITNTELFTYDFDGIASSIVSVGTNNTFKKGTRTRVVVQGFDPDATDPVFKIGNVVAPISRYSPLAPRPDQVLIQSSQVVDGHNYLMDQSAVTLPNGKILYMYYKGVDHLDNAGHIYARIYEDDFETIFTEEFTLVDDPLPFVTSNPAAGVLDSGRIFITYSVFDINNDRIDTKVIYSEDNAETFSSPVSINDGINGPDNEPGYTPYGTPVKTSKGFLQGFFSPWFAKIARTVDGVNWTNSATLAEQIPFNIPGPYNINECTLVKIDDDRVVAIFRQQDIPGNFSYSKTSDAGDSWTPLESAPWTTLSPIPAPITATRVDDDVVFAWGARDPFWKMFANRENAEEFWNNPAIGWAEGRPNRKELFDAPPPSVPPRALNWGYPRFLPHPRYPRELYLTYVAQSDDLSPTSEDLRITRLESNLWLT